MGVVQRTKGIAAFDGPIAGHSTFLSLTMSWPAGAVAANGTYLFTGGAAYAFSVSSLDGAIGSAGGMLSVAVVINGTPVNGLGAVVISTTNKVRTLASGSANTVNPGDIVAAILTVSGAPTDSYIVLNAIKT